MVDEFDVVEQVRGRGLMLGLRLRHSAAAAQQALYGRGLIVNCTAGDVLRMLPPYIVTKEQVQQGLATLRAVLSELEANPEAS